MCRIRWQLIYKSKYVCTSCEKTFKENGVNIPFSGSTEVNIGRPPKKCPECTKEMELVSLDFRCDRLDYVEMVGRLILK